MRASQDRVAELEREVTTLESSLASLEDDTLGDTAKKRIDETLREIDAAAERRDGKSDLDTYADDAKALDTFESQFLGDEPKEEPLIPDGSDS